MVTLTVIVTAAIGRSMASVNAVKARRVAPVAAKVKSSISKLVSSGKQGVAPASPNRLRRRSRGKEAHMRRLYKSLPRVLAPLPEDIHCTSLVEEVEEELLKLHADSDKTSDDFHPSVESSAESTLMGCDELGAFPSLLYVVGQMAQEDKLAECAAAESVSGASDEATKELVYSREAFTASELALFDIKVVPDVVLPEVDYYAADGLVPLDGYDVPLKIQ